MQLFLKNILIILLFSNTICANYRTPQPITLESALLIDGSFITWKTLVEVIHPFMQRLHERVFGIVLSDRVQGLYFYHGVEYTVDRLADHEIYGEVDEAFFELFQDIKTELIALGNDFFGGAEKAKPMIVRLIKESCLARNKNNSLLMVWSEAKQGQEMHIFNTHIKTMNDLRVFCIDLLTFLHDFVHSCPKARQQLHVQLEKWHKVKNLVSSMVEDSTILFGSSEKDKFLHYLKQNALLSVPIDALDSDWVYSHYTVFHGKQQ